MNLSEKSAYIKGLADGLNIDKTTAEGKIIDAMLGLISDMTEEIAELSNKVATLEDYTDELDHDLGELEEFVYSDDDCDCDCDDDCDCCDCCSFLAIEGNCSSSILLFSSSF